MNIFKIRAEAAGLNYGLQREKGADLKVQLWVSVDFLQEYQDKLVDTKKKRFDPQLSALFKTVWEVLDLPLFDAEREKLKDKLAYYVNTLGA